MKTTKINPKLWLPYVVAVAQSGQFAWAGSILFGAAGWVFGALLGIPVAMATAYAASHISGVAKARRIPAWCALGALMILSPIIVGSAAWVELGHFAPVWRVVVSLAWGAVCDGSIALTGFIAGASMVEQDGAPSSIPKPAKKQHVCKVCGYEAKSGKALSGHQRKHSTRKQNNSAGDAIARRFEQEK